MDVNSRKRELVKEFSPMLEKSNTSFKIWIGILIAIICVGLYAFILQFLNGHEITGMRDNVVWGYIYYQFHIFCGY